LDPLVSQLQSAMAQLPEQEEGVILRILNQEQTENKGHLQDFQR
jgi:hypothetical protein